MRDQLSREGEGRPECLPSQGNSGDAVSPVRILAKASRVTVPPPTAPQEAASIRHSRVDSDLVGLRGRRLLPLLAILRAHLSWNEMQHRRMTRAMRPEGSNLSSFAQFHPRVGFAEEPGGESGVSRFADGHHMNI